jgi:hypothetical protein
LPVVSFKTNITWTCSSFTRSFSMQLVVFPELKCSLWGTCFWSVEHLHNKVTELH